MTGLSESDNDIDSLVGSEAETTMETRETSAEIESTVSPMLPLQEKHAEPMTKKPNTAGWEGLSTVLGESFQTMARTECKLSDLHKESHPAKSSHVKQTYVISQKATRTLLTPRE